MQLQDILAALNARLVAATTEFFSQMPHEEHTETVVTVPIQIPVLPAPWAGQTSEDYHTVFPVGLTCDIPMGLKYDPWHLVSTPNGFVRGAWIPVEAAFTLPVE